MDFRKELQQQVAEEAQVVEHEELVDRGYREKSKVIKVINLQPGPQMITKHNKATFSGTQWDSWGPIRKTAAKCDQ